MSVSSPADAVPRLSAQVDGLEEKVRRLEATLRALARLPPDGPESSQALVKTRPTAADPTPTALPWPARASAAGPPEARPADPPNPSPPSDPAADRFAVLGRVLTGVAHDVNNLLAVIQGYAEVLLEELPTGSPHREAAVTIAAAADTAAGVVGHVLTVARPEPGSPPRADVNLLLARLHRLVRAVCGADVRVDVGTGAGVGLADIHPAELTQVVLNLVVNARDAMPGGGSLAVRTAGGWHNPPGADGGEYVVLAVTDSGHGMDAATQARMFDPFFTTRGRTGVGLATVREAVGRAGGAVAVDSTPGAGTTVRVYLRKAGTGV